MHIEAEYVFIHIKTHNGLYDTSHFCCCLFQFQTFCTRLFNIVFSNEKINFKGNIFFFRWFVTLFEPASPSTCCAKGNMWNDYSWRWFTEFGPAHIDMSCAGGNVLAINIWNVCFSLNFPISITHSMECRREE